MELESSSPRAAVAGSGDMWTVKTGSDGTIVIAASFVFIAYFLHPFVEHALHRVRAYRAWRAIERKEMVEVTSYPFAAEVLYGRGKCDAARIIAVLLACFSVASWGLELSLDLASVEDGPVDMMDRPPPVYEYISNSTMDSWQVLARDEFTIDGLDKSGWLENFEGTFEDGEAKSRYRIGDQRFKGSILTAWWSTSWEETESTLYYGGDSGETTVTQLKCAEDEPLKSALLYVEGTSEPWGTVLECEQGPLTSSDESFSPPTIILERSDGGVHVIVEEDSNYPSFLYSVWTPKGDESVGDEDVTLGHAFFIASKSRLVEAIITGIVHGVTTGGGCVDLLYQFSDSNPVYNSGNRSRASPFGEHPGNSTVVKNLSNVEPIEEGVSMDTNASICFFWILVISVVGIGWSFCLRSRVGMDIYNRDELIRAVSLPDQYGDGNAVVAMRMFVRKDESGTISVVIEESDGKVGALKWWDSIKNVFKRLGGGKVAGSPGDGDAEGDVETGGTSRDGSRTPERPRQVVLEGWRLGASRQFPRSHGPWAVSLCASPVPSSLLSSPAVAPTPRRRGFEGMDPTRAGIARSELDLSETVVSRVPKGSVPGTLQFSTDSDSTVGTPATPATPAQPRRNLRTLKSTTPTKQPTVQFSPASSKLASAAPLSDRGLKRSGRTLGPAAFQNRMTSWAESEEDEAGQEESRSQHGRHPME